ARERANDPAVRQDLATAYLKVGDVQGRAGFPNLGNTAGALDSYRKSLAIRESRSPDQRSGIEARRDRATNYDRIGDAQRMTGSAAGALESYRQALGVREALWKADQNNSLNRRDLGVSYERIADALAQTGKPAEA